MTDDNDEFLDANPALECSLWEEWVEVVCGYDKTPTPTHDEWVSLRSRWYPGKAPVDSVAELLRMRGVQ